MDPADHAMIPRAGPRDHRAECAVSGGERGGRAVLGVADRPLRTRRPVDGFLSLSLERGDPSRRAGLGLGRRAREFDLIWGPERPRSSSRSRAEARGRSPAVPSLRESPPPNVVECSDTGSLLLPPGTSGHSLVGWPRGRRGDNVRAGAAEGAGDARPRTSPKAGGRGKGKLSRRHLKIMQPKAVDVAAGVGLRASMGRRGCFRGHVNGGSAITCRSGLGRWGSALVVGEPRAIPKSTNLERKFLLALLHRQVDVVGASGSGVISVAWAAWQRLATCRGGSAPGPAAARTSGHQVMERLSVEKLNFHDVVPACPPVDVDGRGSCGCCWPMTLTGAGLVARKAVDDSSGRWA